MARKSKWAINQYRGFFSAKLPIVKMSLGKSGRKPYKNILLKLNQTSSFQTFKLFSLAECKEPPERSTSSWQISYSTLSNQLLQSTTLAITFTRSWETNQTFWPVKATEGGPQSSRPIAFKVAVFYLSVLLSILHKLKLEFFLSFLTSSFVIVKRIV